MAPQCLALGELRIDEGHGGRTDVLEPPPVTLETDSVREPAAGIRWSGRHGVPTARMPMAITASVQGRAVVHLQFSATA